MKYDKEHYALYVKEIKWKWWGWMGGKRGTKNPRQTRNNTIFCSDNLAEVNREINTYLLEGYTLRIL